MTEDVPLNQEPSEAVDMLPKAMEQPEQSEEIYDPSMMRKLLPLKQRHDRAGITKNHGRGQGKTRRRMAKQSRRVNRARS